MKINKTNTGVIILTIGFVVAMSPIMTSLAGLVLSEQQKLTQGIGITLESFGLMIILLNLGNPNE